MNANFQITRTPFLPRLYRKKGSYEEKFFSASDKYPVSFMSWGAIGYNFKLDLYIFNSTVTAESYINMFAELEFFEKAQVHLDEEKICPWQKCRFFSYHKSY